MSYTPYLIPYVIAATMVLVLLPVLRKRRLSRGATTFALLAVSSAIWCIGNALELAAVSLRVKTFFANVQYFGIMSMGGLWLIFALQYSGRVRRLSWPWLVALTAVPVITVVLVWEGDNGLVRYGARLLPGTPFVDVAYGPWFYFAAACNYTQLTVGGVVLLASLARSHLLFRAQGLLLVFCSAVVLVANLAHLLGASPYAPFDPTPASFALCVVAVAVAVLRFRMFDLVPAARRAVIATMPDGILVVDAMGRIVEANPAAAFLLGRRGRSLVGQSLKIVLPDRGADLLSQPMTGSDQRLLEMTTTGRLLEAGMVPLHHGGVVSGWLVVFHDVTEREMRLRQLQAALAEVRTLSGLIPICACCKRVRDDYGYWQQVEEYVSSHSQAQFTHGICPECAAALYPEQALSSELGTRSACPERPRLEALDAT